MNQYKDEYYPKDKNFTEICASFFGKRTNPRDLRCYLNLLNIRKKQELSYPDYRIENEFFSYGNFLKFDFRTILDRVDKNNVAKQICNELIRYGVKTNSIPIIELIQYGNQTTILNLDKYLKSRGIKLQDLNIEEIIFDEKVLNESR